MNCGSSLCLCGLCGSVRWPGSHGGAVPPLLTNSSSVLLRQDGVWHSLLQRCDAYTCANTSSSNKIQRIYAGLKITACMAGANSEQKTKKNTQKNPNCLFWRARSKNEVLGAKESRVPRMPLALNTTRGVGKTPKPPLWPDAWTHPYPHPISETSSPAPSGSEQAPPAATEAPVKLRLTFLTGIFSISADWGRLRTLLSNTSSCSDWKSQGNSTGLPSNMFKNMTLCYQLTVTKRVEATAIPPAL